MITYDIKGDDSDRVIAHRCIGEDARPTGRQRMLRCLDTGAGRMQAEWRGSFGSMWLDVPVVEIPDLPPRWLEAAPPSE